MEVANLAVENRAAAGTNQVRNLRDTGKIPLVLYGGGKESVSLQADYHEVKRHLEHHLRVYKLDMGGTTQPGYLQDVQWDCLTDEPLHMDFRRIEMDQYLDLEVNLVTLGVPKGETAGSRMIRDIQTLSLSCLPDSVPDLIELKVQDLEPGDKVLAKDLELPEGCKLNIPEDRLIVHMTEL